MKGGEIESRFTMWTVIAAVALVVVVSTAGCTSNTGNTTQSPTPSVSTAPSVSMGKDYTQHYNDTFKHIYNDTSKGAYATHAGFSKSKSTDNNDLYMDVGTFTRPGFTANNDTIAIEIMPSQTAAQTKFDKVVADQVSAGYRTSSDVNAGYNIGDVGPIGTVKSTWAGAQYQDGQYIIKIVYLTQDSGADNNWTVSTSTLAGIQ